MKKFGLLCMCLCSLSLLWCNNTEINSDIVDQDINNNEQLNVIDTLNSELYEWILEIKWVWPEISFEPTVSEWTLVATQSFEDHTDHIFFLEWSRENLLTENSDILPWNTINFKGNVIFIDWAAWNHYYEVSSIDNLSINEYLTQDWIEEF